jgi:hypothetical protein
MINASTPDYGIQLQDAVLRLSRAGFHASTCGIWIAVTDRTCLGITTMLAPDQVDSFIATFQPTPPTN